MCVDTILFMKLLLGLTLIPLVVFLWDLIAIEFIKPYFYSNSNESDNLSEEDTPVAK